MINNIKGYDIKENRGKVMDYFLNKKNTLIKAASLTNNFFDNPSVFNEEEINNILSLLKKTGTELKREYNEVIIRDGQILFN